MTNFEKYKNEILRVINSGDRIAVDRSGKLRSCAAINCIDCSFFKQGSCEVAKFKWLCAENTEPETEKQAHTCADCKHFCFADTRVGAHFMQKERYGYCLEYNLFPVFPSVVFCPKYEQESEE